MSAKWTASVVMDRFVEAADTERRSPSRGMPMAGTCWPGYRFSEEDREGWTDADKADEQQRWAETKGAKSDAVSRYDEVVAWGLNCIPDVMTRRIVWTWAFCIVIPGRSFSKACEVNGWARPTAYRRLTAAMERISANLSNTNTLLRVSAYDWVRQQPPPVASICATDEAIAPAPSAIKFTPSYRTEKSRDLLQTPKAIAEFTQHRDRVNAERRRIQAIEAKRREKLGAVGAA